MMCTFAASRRSFVFAFEITFQQFFVRFSCFFPAMAWTFNNECFDRSVIFQLQGIISCTWRGDFAGAWIALQRLWKMFARDRNNCTSRGFHGLRGMVILNLVDCFLVRRPRPGLVVVREVACCCLNARSANESIPSHQLLRYTIGNFASRRGLAFSYLLDCFAIRG